MMRKTLKSCVNAALLLSAFSCGVGNATTVQFQTSLGDFEVNLYDQSTPETVANFLAYLDAGTYSNSIIHRSVPGFVVQGGGFAITEDNKIDRSPALWSPINEPVYSNVRGTIAMAKIGGDPNSATNQWFINLSNNSSILDLQNGGFTVFGEVTSDGMDVVDAIASLPRIKFDDGAFASTPVRDFADGGSENFAEDPGRYLVTVDDIVVLDAAEDTAAGLSPPVNSLIDEDEDEDEDQGAPSIDPPVVQPLQKKKKGGAFDAVGLLWLSVLAGGFMGASYSTRRR